MEQLLPDAELRGLLQQLDPGSAIAVPIRTPDRNLGVLALFYGAGHLPHDLYDLETALEIGRRAGLLIENATLYAGQRQLAETMQRSLLTEPPKADHLQVAVRYRPAAQQARVGGDWYDAFFTADGAVCLVIGDVAGHDGEAAATMGQVRNVLRGVAYTSTDRPAGVLSMLDRALRDLEVGDLATGTLIRVDRPELRKPSGDRLLRWSNAGHPPPVLVEPGGRARLLESDPDLLLGLDPGTDRTDHDVVLGAGGTVLLYTDGLVERRGASLDDGLAWLVEAVQELAYLDLEELCDALLEATADTTEDDVALLAVRSYDLVAGNDAGAAGSRGGSSGVGT
jgi:serine phosphatase RsbU (regulator of sigma subunit)